MFRVISEGFRRHRNVPDFIRNVPVKELCQGVDLLMGLVFN
jgi:hypothetical protein